MSGIGAIIDGAFKGYSFGEAVKDKKAARKIRDEELEWAREDRDYLKTKRGWEAEDREVSVAERNRQIAASDEAERVHREAYETAQDEHATRGAPNPAELPGVTAAPVAPAAPGGASPNPNQPLGRSMRPTPAPEAPRTGPAPMTPPSAPPDAAPRSMAPGMVSTRSAPTQPATDQIPQSFLNDPTIQARLAQSTIPADRVWAHMNEETKQAWRDKDARRQTPQAPAQPIVPRSMTPPAPTNPNTGPSLGPATAPDAAPVIGQGADPRPRTSASPTAPAAPPYQPSKSSSVREVNPEASAFMQDIQSLMRNGDIEGALSKIEVGLATGKYGPAASPLARTAGAVGDYFTKSPSEGAAASDARRLSASALRWYQSPDAKEFFSQNPQALASAAQDPVGFLQQLASGQMPEQSSGIPVDPPSQAPAQPTQPRPAQAPSGGAPSAPPQPVAPSGPQRTMRQTPPSALPSNDVIEQEAAARSEDPNVEASRAATVKTMKTPDMTKTRAADSFLDTYRRVAVPQIIDHYLKTGDIDKAKSFETWVKTSEAEQLQKDFGRLTYSLVIGDLNASIDHLTEMYESINDGYSVNRGESRFETYENGQPSRLVVVVEDAEGNKFDWVVEDQGDLAAQVLGLVNPQAAHQYLLERNEAAVAARAASSKSIKPAPIDRKEVTSEVKRIKDDLIEMQGQAAVSGQQFQMPSDAEIEQMAVENLRARDAAISGSGNRSYQPNGTPVPDWVPGS